MQPRIIEILVIVETVWPDFEIEFNIAIKRRRCGIPLGQITKKLVRRDFQWDSRRRNIDFEFATAFYCSQSYNALALKLVGIYAHLLIVIFNAVISGVIRNQLKDTVLKIIRNVVPASEKSLNIAPYLAVRTVHAFVHLTVVALSELLLPVGNGLLDLLSSILFFHVVAPLHIQRRAAVPPRASMLSVTIFIYPVTTKRCRTRPASTDRIR